MKIGRNDPCWCGSGVKYKKCHLDRSSQERDNPWSAVEKNKKAFNEKRCYAKDAGLGECDGNIIKAHTVSRGPNLSKIAETGKVLRYNVDPAELKRNGGKLSVSRIGISDASVFRGFCAKHDRALFSCIENESFTGTPQQCLTIAYRTLSREFYGKTAATHLRETLRGADKGRSTIEQMMIQHMLDTIDQANDLAKKDLGTSYAKLTKAMVEKDYSTLESAVIEFDGPLPFMLAGAWSPFVDLYGRELQNGVSQELLEQIFVSSFASVSGGSICLSWISKPSAPGAVIAEQITRLPVSSQASACLQLCVRQVENVFFNPSWFSALSAQERSQLDMLAAVGVETLHNVLNEEIALDMEFGLPAAARLSTVRDNRRESTTINSPASPPGAAASIA